MYFYDDNKLYKQKKKKDSIRHVNFGFEFECEHNGEWRRDVDVAERKTFFISSWNGRDVKANKGWKSHKKMSEIFFFPTNSTEIPQNHRDKLIKLKDD